MSRILLYVIALGLLIHGLIHLMGLVAYWPLGVIDELPYKTTLLGGRWTVGAGGMRAFSVIWLLATLGFVIAAIGVLLGASWWQPVLIITTLISLVICVLDWSVAFRGAIINIVILAAILLQPLASTWFTQAER